MVARSSTVHTLTSGAMCIARLSSMKCIPRPCAEDHRGWLAARHHNRAIVAELTLGEFAESMGPGNGSAIRYLRSLSFARKPTRGPDCVKARYIHSSAHCTGAIDGEREEVRIGVGVGGRNRHRSAIRRRPD